MMVMWDMTTPLNSPVGDRENSMYAKSAAVKDSSPLRFPWKEPNSLVFHHSTPRGQASFWMARSRWKALRLLSVVRARWACVEFSM